MEDLANLPHKHLRIFCKTHFKYFVSLFKSFAPPHRQHLRRHLHHSRHLQIPVHEGGGRKIGVNGLITHVTYTQHQTPEHLQQHLQKRRGRKDD